MTKLIVIPALLKAHIDSYTRKDGTFVQAHDDKRQAAAPKHHQIVDAAKPRVVMRKDAAPAGSMTPDAVKDHAMKAGAKFKSGVAVFSKPESAHSFARQAAGSKGGAFVMKHPDHSHHVVVNGADAQRMEKNGYQHVANEAKTGSAAPAKMTNVGSEKWPLHAKTSEKLPAKHEDGSTHHVGGFKPPEYPAGGGATDGDVIVHHEGKTYSFTGKKGKNLKTGEASYEFSHSGEGVERRAWVSKSGHLQED